MRYFTSHQKVHLIRSLLTRTSPAYIQFYITGRCNHQCEQCNIIYAQADSEEMNIGQIRAMARNMAEIGVCIVLFIGGEPFMRKDLCEIAAAFTEVGIHVRLQTNGLASKEELKECVQAGAHDITMSLDCLDNGIQDAINGKVNRSWERTIQTIANVNEVFPANGTGVFCSVMMPRNINHLLDVMEFANAIGWTPAIVPAHLSTPDKPRGFMAFDDENVCRFSPPTYPYVQKKLEEIKESSKGYNVFASNDYFDDIYRFITGAPLRWRIRNNNICDSPNLYFAVEPNGNISPCCDYKLQNYYPVYHRDFPKWYRSGVIHNEIYAITRECSGCMYGSYPEITITARYFEAMLKRFLFYNANEYPTLKKFSADEMTDIAQRIFIKNSEKREKEEKIFRVLNDLGCATDTERAQGIS
jgi:MoaA/NifB/PqqE/SkfB family radical SAM enzyme